MAPTWLEQVLVSTDELESPKSFFYWSALATIAAIVKDSVWINRGKAYKLYPNIYVMLLARSGLRKGPPINLAKRLVTKINNTRIISGRSSIQAILKEMGTAVSSQGGKVSAKSDAFIISSELSSSLVEDKATMNILTDLYDRQYNEGEWRSLLKMEVFNLKDPIVTMLVGTNEPHFKDFFQEKDVHGGFIGRMFVIAENKKNRSNDLIDDMVNPLNDELLLPHLKLLSKVSGQFQSLSGTDAGKLYSKWYKDLDAVSDRVEDKTGTLERIGDSVLKVSMLLSLSESTNLIISVHNMEVALNLCERLVGNIRKSTMTQGSKQSYAEQKTLIIEELMKRDNHLISQEQLMRKYWMHFNLDQLSQIMLSFDQAKLIITESVGNKIVYRMPQERFDELTKYMAGK